MTGLVMLFGIGLLALATLLWICVWAPRRALVKAAALAVGALFVPIAYASLGELMSKPKPVRMEWYLGHAAQATVLASNIQEGRGIYLWLQLADIPEPRSYVLPWNRQTAEELQQATRDAEANQGGVGVRLPFEPTLDDREPKFYPLPQPALPPKDLAPPPAMRFTHPGTDA